MKADTRVAVGLALEAIEKPKAKERERVRKGKQPGAKSGKLPDLGDTRDAVGAGVGMSGIPVTECRTLQLRTCPGCGERLTPFDFLSVTVEAKRDGVPMVEAVVYPVCIDCHRRVREEEVTFSAMSANRDAFPSPDRPTFLGGCDAVVREWVQMDRDLSAFRGEPHAG